ncbi:MAG: hypothetical protein ACD_79C00742G0001 [uncultured bacterium]|nr:MAG: hypothetical protein ACD_79C00742G0001 [uncultured bacterium]
MTNFGAFVYAMNKQDIKEKDIEQENILKALKILEQNSSPTQRELAKGLNLSLGKINFVIKSLINQGFIKVERFINSNKKSAYFYYLTPQGFETKLFLTKNFLKRKIDEYNKLKDEIEFLENDLNESRK